MTSARAIVRSNCFAWAVCRYARLVRAWWRDGREIGREPALRIRCSRLQPRKVPHFAVEHCGPTGWVREEWVPLDATPLPWWLLWRALWTDGAVMVEVLHAGG